MGQDQSIASLRSRVSALVAQEGLLLTQAFALNRAGGERQGVDALFARVQALQVERNSLHKQIAALLGAHRLHTASEVWKLGDYDYCEEVGGASERVRVTKGPLGLQVRLPGRQDAVRIEALHGTFDGPLGADGAAERRELQTGFFPHAPEGVGKARARRRPATRKNVA